MKALHIKQDSAGFWMLSGESEDGSLELMAYHFDSPRHLISDAHELVADGTYPDAVVIVAPPKQMNEAPAPLAMAGAALAGYSRPQPGKAA